MRSRDSRDTYAADSDAAAEAREHRIRWIPAIGLELCREERWHFAAGDDLRVFRQRDVHSQRIWHRRHRQVGVGASARVGRLVVRVAQVVAMHVADKNDVNFAQPRIARAGDRTARIVKHAGAVRVFKNKRTVLRAEFAVNAAQRCYLDGLGKGR